MNAFSLVNVLKRTISNSSYMKLLVFCHMISRNRRTFTLNFCRVMSVFGGDRRSAPVHRHRQQTSFIIVPAPQLQMKYKQMLLQSKKSSSSAEFFVEKPHYKWEDGPLSIQSRLLKVAKNEMNTLHPFLIITLPSFRIPYTFIQLLLFGIVLFNLLKQSIKLIELTERYETEFDNLHGMLDWNQLSSNRTIAFDWFVDWICTPGSKVLRLFSPRFVDEFCYYC